MSAQFDPFGDYETRGYLQNSGGFTSDKAIGLLETHSFKTGLKKAVSDLAKAELTYASVLRTHETLFSEAYPTWAGKDRVETAPNLRIRRGGMSGDFAHPQEIRRAVDYALDPTVKHTVGDVFSLLAHAHPFLDGNGRTLLLVQTEILRRQGQHLVLGAMDARLFLAALTEELARPKVGALDAYLKHYIREGSQSLKECAESIAEFMRNKAPRELTMTDLIAAFKR